MLEADRYLLGTPVHIALGTLSTAVGGAGWHPTRRTQDGLVVMNMGHDAPPDPGQDRTPHYRPGILRKPKVCGGASGGISGGKYFG